jgi:hypothetical protein
MPETTLSESKTAYMCNTFESITHHHRNMRPLEPVQLRAVVSVTCDTRSSIRDQLFRGMRLDTNVYRQLVKGVHNIWQEIQ